MDFYSKILYQNILLLFTALFASVSIYLLPLFRLRKGDAAALNEVSDSEFFEVVSEEEVYSKEHNNVKAEQELQQKFEAFDDVLENGDSDKIEDKEKTEFCFEFKFPTYEEFCTSKKETGELISTSEKSFSSLIQEPEVVNVNVKQSVSEKSFSSLIQEPEFVNVNVKEDIEVETEKIEGIKIEEKRADFSDEFSSSTDSDTVSIGFEHMRSLMNRLVNSYSDGFLSDEDFGGEFELEMPEENIEPDEFEDSDIEIMEEYKKLEQEEEGTNFLSQDDFYEDSSQVQTVEFVTEEDKSINGKSKETDANKLESLWEHQELIEQLKMEIRKVRATGLPTILEECESPTMDDLKPWKINEMLQREDCMSELHKFYKSYRERMRKFDILTYQKMYAIGYLQKDPLKDPLQLLYNQKSSGPTLKSLVSQNIRLFKHKSHEIDPMVKFIKELQSDLEVVYVGQMCLTWEFLHWQYMKALSLWDSDPRGIRKYNEVAGEFQQFQVLLQRFIENEPFQGPRVQYYIKSRYDLRNLLQVPVIRDDRVKARNKERKMEKGDYAITNDMLVEILEESIRIFWRFVRADKDCHIVMGKGQKGIHPEIEEQEDLELLLETRKDLEKKEKKLQDALRGGNCILRKLKKQSDDDTDHVLYFFSQVDMKLVARVLNMSKLTKDQLVWCHSKLSRISFVHRKIHVEPSFLLFPC